MKTAVAETTRARAARAAAAPGGVSHLTAAGAATPRPSETCSL